MRKNYGHIGILGLLIFSLVTNVSLAIAILSYDSFNRALWIAGGARTLVKQLIKCSDTFTPQNLAKRPGIHPNQGTGSR